MTNQHPITPPDDLIQSWVQDYWGIPGWLPGGANKYVATQAAQWGSNQELGACCDWLAKYRSKLYAADLRYVRRPKPPSIKEQALEALSKGCFPSNDEIISIRRALEALPND
jgi:hypothetical protein